MRRQGGGGGERKFAAVLFETRTNGRKKEGADAWFCAMGRQENEKAKKKGGGREDSPMNGGVAVCRSAAQGEEKEGILRCLALPHK